MKFKYKALKSSGESYEGELEAADKFALYHDLKARGETPVSVREVIERRWNVTWRKFVPQIRTVKVHDRIMFARNLGGMLEAGLALSRALAVIERQAKNKLLKTITANLRENVEKGRSLHEALSDFPDVFSPLFVSMVKVGEESGTLSRSLKSVADHLESTYLLGRKVKGAMIYPALILVLMTGIGLLMLLYVVPSLTGTFKELQVDLPWSTKIIVFVSDTLRENTLIFVGLIGVVLAVLWTVYRAAKWRRVVDPLLLRTPFLKTVIVETNTARTARTLSSLLLAGVDMLVAIDITADVVRHNAYHASLLEAKESVGKGGRLSEAFLRHPDHYPAFLVEMTSVGEETGKLSEMLGNTATFYEGEVEQKMKNFSTIIEPLLMILIGIGVGFFAVAMILPTYALIGSL